MYEAFGISEKIELLAEEVENEVKDVFRAIDKRCEKNSLNVLKAFQNTYGSIVERLSKENIERPNYHTEPLVVCRREIEGKPLILLKEQ